MRCFACGRQAVGQARNWAGNASPTCGRPECVEYIREDPIGALRGVVVASVATLIFLAVLALVVH